MRELPIDGGCCPDDCLLSVCLALPPSLVGMCVGSLSAVYRLVWVEELCEFAFGTVWKLSSQRCHLESVSNTRVGHWFIYKHLEVNTNMTPLLCSRDLFLSSACYIPVSFPLRMLALENRILLHS